MQTETVAQRPVLRFQELPLTLCEEQAHQRAIDWSQRHHQTVPKLLEVIDEVDRLQIYKKFCLRSLTAYCAKFLNLKDEVAGYYISVARKSRQIPQLKQAVADGEVSVTKAGRLCKVLNPENQAQWLQKAAKLSKAQLEKAIAEASPKPVTKSGAKPSGPNRTKYQFEADNEFNKVYERALDLESQRAGKTATMQEVLLAALESYLDQRDPIRKAERAHKRKAPPKPKENFGRASEKRAAIPAHVVHQVFLRDRNECCVQLPNGEICRATRFTHIHHLVALADGGTNELGNLITVCGEHHRQWHRLQERHARKPCPGRVF